MWETTTSVSAIVPKYRLALPAPADINVVPTLVLNLFSNVDSQDNDNYVDSQDNDNWTMICAQSWSQHAAPAPSSPDRSRATLAVREMHGYMLIDLIRHIMAAPDRMEASCDIDTS